ncbi:30S ribosomal protein S9 [Rudanella paleaurantiibacter]|uniref:Small ribosomal subunit protein uS9 n=1 Tax=Rudanella paleaurantiibacter TaxID=2614655 RepID=A0A7J5U322_9BACT|nr:30S ribosomal protein S9 [Rudanella paleaurantiibacter]KAB7732204.1 30S ribosomal protein S9 [Rudanella paleaurantiibacter]
MDRINAIGRRKTAVSRVYLSAGNGNIQVNGKEYKQYFPSEILQIILNQPFTSVNGIGAYDVKVNVRGGGITGQAEATRMAISRALVELNAEFRPTLKKEGFLTRDSRMVERKKYGRAKARRRFQFSKR